ncbi:MAG: PorV/PorQ family protein, partial [Candidatus Eisenbacteria bacterium]|nr:PorV/PorQ family protein [Candidatus Eisenbacteria bacterium]
MTSKRFAVAVTLLVFLTASVVQAQGTSGSQFLGVGVGARASAMGGAYSSLADDGTSLYWNPAGLTQVRGRTLTVSHVSWLSDATYQYAAYAGPLGASGALGVALEQGGVSWDNTGQETPFDAGDFVATIGYGRRIMPDLGAGLGVKLLSSTLGEGSAQSFAMDLGLVYRATEAGRLAATVRNLGPGLTFESESDPLPLSLTMGGSYLWHGLTLSLDLEKVSDLAAATRLGAEYSPVNHLALRGGWIAEEDSALSSFTGGFGVDWNNRWALDYAYRASDLGATHQFALSAGLGGESRGLEAEPGDGSGSAMSETRLPKTNLAVISELTREVMDEALDKMNLPEGAQVILKQVENHDANWLVKSVLLEELTSRGHAVRTGQVGNATALSEEPVYEIDYRIVNCQTTIPRSWREWFVGARKVERRTAVDVRFELSDKQGSIVWAAGVQRERREIISGSRLRDLESPGQSFASPQ